MPQPCHPAGKQRQGGGGPMCRIQSITLPRLDVGYRVTGGPL